ncbi:MAG: hypothetical protein HEEMFOPI_01863 [Holosporales bacterium]
MGKSEEFRMSANQVAEEIFNISKQSNTSESHQKMDTALKSKSFDTNNQQDHKNFQKTVYTPQKPMGVDKQDSHQTRNAVHHQIEKAESRTNDALEAPKAQHVRAHQTFKDDHTKHASENMGFTQEDVTKDQLKDFEDKKKNA